MLTSNDPSKKKTSAYNTSSQYQTAVQPGMASPNSNLQSPSTPGTVNVAGTQTQIPTQSSGKSGGFNRGPITPISTTPGLQPQPSPQQPPPGYIKQGSHYVSPDNKMIWAIGPDGKTYHSKNSLEATTGGHTIMPVEGPGFQPLQFNPNSYHDEYGNVHQPQNAGYKNDPTASKANYDKFEAKRKQDWIDRYGDINAKSPLNGGIGKTPWNGNSTSPGQPMTLRTAYSTLQNAGFGNNILM